jgi:hypothetical protein
MIKTLTVGVDRSPDDAGCVNVADLGTQKLGSGLQARTAHSLVKVKAWVKVEVQITQDPFF